MKMYQLGENIRHIRLLKGFKQKDFADLLGVSVVTLSKWENGKVLISTENLRKVCGCLQINTDELFETNIAQHLVEKLGNKLPSLN